MKKSFVILFLFLLFFSFCVGDRQFRFKSHILTKVKNAADLATIKFKMRKILYVRKNKNLLFFKLPSSFYLATVEPVIEAGIDIGLIQENDISIDENHKKIKIKLPPVKIIQYDYNEDEIINHWDFTGDNILNRLKIEDYENIHVLADHDIRIYLNYLGIRQDIENSVKRFLNKFIGKLGYECEFNFGQDEPLIFYDYKVDILEGKY